STIFIGKLAGVGGRSVHFSRFGGRVFPGSVQQPPEVHQPFAIEVERRDGGSAGRCLAEEPGPVLVPGEMLAPALLARMVEGNLLPSHGVRSPGLIVFAVVASLTGHCQVCQHRFATLAAWLNVFNGEGLCAKTLLTAAVFAAAASACQHQ